jgi:hypothetical protein
MAFGNEPGFDRALSQFKANISPSQGPASCRKDDAPPLPEVFIDNLELSTAPNGAGPKSIPPGALRHKQDGAERFPRGKGDDVDIGPWFKAPKGFYSSGLAASLRPSDQAVYFALLYRLNNSKQRTSNSVTVNDKLLAAECGVKTRTIRDSRIRLCEAGVISTSPGRPGKWYTYTLPALSFENVAIEDRPLRKCQPRAKYAKRKVRAA